MIIQERILTFVTFSNWVLLLAMLAVASLIAAFNTFIGIAVGGLIVTVNFHLLYRTLRKTFKPSHMGSHQAAVAKYYVRFIISGSLISVLMIYKWVDPFGLVLGLSVVVASIMLATVVSIKYLFTKEAI